MDALEIGNLRLVSGFDQSLESLFHQGCQPSAEHGLLAEKIALGFFFECCLENSRARGSDAIRIRERQLVRVSARILMNGD